MQNTPYKKHDLPVSDPWPAGEYQRSKFENINYNYDGMSNTIVAEHRGSFLQDYENEGGSYPPVYIGNRFVATYLHGPLGPIARTAEFDNNDAADNRDTYYLRDAMGGHFGLLTDDDGDLSNPQRFSSTTYDAFGNAMSASRPPPGAGSFAWRGAEGSVYDANPTLVYMQARHYDPTIGRFIQPDSLALASMTTQGMNRYIYCENDPVNHSDPSGNFLQVIGAFIIAALWLFSVSLVGHALEKLFLRKLGIKVTKECLLTGFLSDLLGVFLGLPSSVGYLGYGLIGIGWVLSHYPFGFLIGWIPMAVGLFLVGFDLAIDWLAGAGADWLINTTVSDGRSDPRGSGAEQLCNPYSRRGAAFCACRNQGLPSRNQYLLV